MQQLRCGRFFEEMQIINTLGAQELFPLPFFFFYNFMRWFGLRFGPGPAGHESVMWQCFEVKTQVSRKALEQLRQEKG